MKKLTFHEWNQILVSYRFESVQLFSDNLELRVALYSKFFILEKGATFVGFRFLKKWLKLGVRGVSGVTNRMQKKNFQKIDF